MTPPQAQTAFLTKHGHLPPTASRSWTSSWLTSRPTTSSRTIGTTLYKPCYQKVMHLLGMLNAIGRQANSALSR
eukprot:9082057-Pyramimonas_sp.AAC.1